MQIQDYIFTLGALFQPNNIIFCSKISNGRICAYLTNKQCVNDCLTNASINIKGKLIYGRKLVTPITRLLLSNVCPTIPHEILENKLNQFVQLLF